MEKMQYTNGEVTVVWQPKMCQHTGICARGLPAVFQPKERPWIKLGAADTLTIIDQVKKCPSGALSYFMNAEKTA
ncbi:(4Fe-4S)-binding protein [Chitinophaga lutea]